MNGRGLVAALAGAATLLASGCRLDSRFLYFPQPHSEAAWRAIAIRSGAEPVQIARDGVTLRGWFAPPPGSASSPSGGTGGAARGPAILYFGGNGEEVSWMLGEVGRLGGHGLLAVNYRGYGASSGVPLEQDLYGDALAAFDYLAARAEVDPARIAVWGRSLGSGVATWVAARRPVSAVVLTSPYDSIEALARRHYPVIAFLLGQRYDSLSRAATIRAPLLAIVAGRDTIVPAEHSERLAAAWAGPVRVLRLSAAGHNDVQEFPEHWREVRAFLAGTQPR